MNKNISDVWSDVWQLETPLEELACNKINYLYEQAYKKRRLRKLLEECFEDDWKTIKERFETEGSVWYVWYMDGVRKFITNHLTIKK